MKKINKKINESIMTSGLPSKVITLKSLVPKKLKEEYEDNPKMDTAQKRAFLEAVSAFTSYAPSIYREHSLQDVCGRLKEMLSTANNLTLQETEDWFDKVTVSKHMKQMDEAYKLFEKTAKEISTLQQRLESAYEDIGGTLGKYYNINELTEISEQLNEEETDYQKHFKKTLRKLKIKDPSDLPDEKAKRKFFAYLDKTYVAPKEKNPEDTEGNEEETE